MAPSQSIRPYLYLFLTLSVTFSALVRYSISSKKQPEKQTIMNTKTEVVQVEAVELADERSKSEGATSQDTSLPLIQQKAPLPARHHVAKSKKKPVRGSKVKRKKRWASPASNKKDKAFDTLKKPLMLLFLLACNLPMIRDTWATKPTNNASSRHTKSPSLLSNTNTVIERGDFLGNGYREEQNELRRADTNDSGNSDMTRASSGSSQEYGMGEISVYP